MLENTHNQLSINTTRLYSDNQNFIELKKEIKDTEKSLESIIDWLIKAKCRVKILPINMRKLAGYAQYIKEKIILPLVLRKRALYERLVNS